MQDTYLKSKISNIRLSPDLNYLLITGYDGRVSIQKINYTRYSIASLMNTLCFKAHEIPKKQRMRNLYQINDCGFIQCELNNINAFYTCGSNGYITTWEIGPKEKVKNISTKGNIIFFI